MADYNFLDADVQRHLESAESRLNGEKNIRQTSSPPTLPKFTKRPNSSSSTLNQSYISSDHGVVIANSSLLTVDKQPETITVRGVEKPRCVQRRKLEAKATAGEGWFRMPRADLTSDLKKDFQLLKMRGVLDPKRHYKKDTSKKIVPNYFQVGTIVQGPTEYFSFRISKKDRKGTLTREVLSTEAHDARFKRRYRDIQTFKTSGKQGFYRALQRRRAKGS